MFTSRSMLRWRGWDAWRSGWTPQACRPAIHVFGRRSAFRAQGPGTRRRAPCPATGLASLTPSVSDPGDCSPHALHTLSEPLQRFVTVDRVKRGSLDTRWERAAQPKLPLLTSARSVHRRSRVNPGPLLDADTFSKCSGHTLEHGGLKHEPSVRSRRQITKYPVGHDGELNLRLEFFPSTRIVHGNAHSENRLTGDELMKSSGSFFLTCSFRGLLSLIVLITFLIVLTIFVVLDRRLEEKAVSRIEQRNGNPPYQTCRTSPA